MISLTEHVQKIKRTFGNTLTAEHDLHSLSGGGDVKLGTSMVAMVTFHSAQGHRGHMTMLLHIHNTLGEEDLIK